ncbi:MAG TPA: hypothetical protein VL049_30645 [Candidatus Dormibacteraeota bacterium]|nr:hypothetical protein [Candidatus Dormibacteraeota bacterium]
MSDPGLGRRAARAALHFLPLPALFAVFLWLSYPPPESAAFPIKVFPDSPTYTTWGYGRPPVPFLFYSLVGSGPAAPLAQTILSLTCWLALGWIALGFPGALTAGLLAGALPVVLWNKTVLSESLALSFGAAFLAASLALGRRWSPWRLVVWIACLLLYTGVRAENFFLVPPVLAALLVWHRRHWKAVGAAGLAALGLFVAFSIVIDKQNHNWQIRMTNIVLTRILPDLKLRAEFLARGLPEEPALLAARGRMLAAYDPAFVAATPEFQRWLDDQSRPTYLAWLRTFEPHKMLFEAMDHVMKHWPSVFNYYIAGVRLPGSAWDFYPWSHAMRMPFAEWRWLPLIPIACALLTLELTFADLFALAYVAAVYLMAFAVYHGDTGELDRHLVLTATLYRFAPVVALAPVWERVRLLWRSPPPSPS